MFICRFTLWGFLGGTICLQLAELIIMDTLHDQLTWLNLRVFLWPWLWNLAKYDKWCMLNNSINTLLLILLQRNNFCYMTACRSGCSDFKTSRNIHVGYNRGQSIHSSEQFICVFSGRVPLSSFHSHFFQGLTVGFNIMSAQCTVMYMSVVFIWVSESRCIMDSFITKKQRWPWVIRTATWP